MSSQKQLIPMTSSQKQLIPKPPIIYDHDEDYGTFVNQDDNKNSNAQFGISLIWDSVIHQKIANGMCCFP
ncbi:hypothetical protein N7451_000766 [Penicillium sp. IBT 35674x]|nr:hypothetical protein N7451_000766 [Penicillium sp. IBT 35674x]